MDAQKPQHHPFGGFDFALWICSLYSTRAVNSSWSENQIISPCGRRLPRRHNGASLILVVFHTPPARRVARYAARQIPPPRAWRSLSPRAPQQSRLHHLNPQIALSTMPDLLRPLAGPVRPRQDVVSAILNDYSDFWYDEDESGAPLPVERLPSPPPKSDKPHPPRSTSFRPYCKD